MRPRTRCVVADAERYYRVMYHGSVDSWNLRDQHMFETLQTVRAHRGPGTKVVVWEHNSHIGDASATEMGARGEHNVGQLCRREYGDDAFLVGFGTDRGTVAAASDWGGPMERKAVRPVARPQLRAGLPRLGRPGVHAAPPGPGARRGAHGAGARRGWSGPSG